MAQQLGLVCLQLTGSVGLYEHFLVCYIFTVNKKCQLQDNQLHGVLNHGHLQHETIRPFAEDLDLLSQEIYNRQRNYDIVS